MLLMCFLDEFCNHQRSDHLFLLSALATRCNLSPKHPRYRAQPDRYGPRVSEPGLCNLNPNASAIIQVRAFTHGTSIKIFRVFEERSLEQVHPTALLANGVCRALPGKGFTGFSLCPIRLWVHQETLQGRVMLLPSCAS
jgi:hypothetical protein